MSEEEDIERFEANYQLIHNMITDGYFLDFDYIEALRYARGCMENYAKKELGIERPWENV